MPRFKKYRTAAALQKGVDAYFDAISYEENVTVRVPTQQRDKDGHVIYEDKPVIARNGRQAVRTMWTEPPSIAGLCLSLGICRDTWAAYAKDEVFSDTVTRARGRVEAYLVGRLETKGARGVIFNLQENFGWKERKELGLDAPTRAAVGAGMSMAEKLELLKEMGLRVPGGEGGEEK